MKKMTLASLVLGLWITTAPGAWAQDTDPQPLPNPTSLPKDLKNDAPIPVLSEPARRERLTFLLSGYEFFPKRADLDRVGAPAKVSATLRAMALDGALRPSLRTRAVDALGYYNDAKTHAYLTSVAKRELKGVRPRERRAMSAMRHHAILSMTRANATQSIPTLTKLLGHKDLQIRLTAVQALGRFGGDTGLAVLKKHRSKATHAVEKRALLKYVR